MNISIKRNLQVLPYSFDPNGQQNMPPQNMLLLYILSCRHLKKTANAGRGFL